MKNLILLFLIVLLAPLANATGLDFLLNGVSKPVKVDTVTPANSVPYPFMYLNTSGVRTNLGTEATLQTINTSILGVNTTISGIDFAKDATLQSVLSGITSLNGKDFATQTTLAVLAGKDFATQTTLSAMNTKFTTTANGLKVDGSAVTQPVSVGSLPLPAGAATAANQSTEISSLSSIDGKLTGVSTAANQTATQNLIGAVNETAPASDTASSGLNGRMQRTAQNITAMSAKLPATLGAKTTANSLSVTLPTDQGTLAVSQVAATGSFAQITNLVNTAQTFTAPANAVGFKIQAPSTNTENISFSIGSTATITAGILMEPGRSEDFDTGSNISVIAASATQQTVTVIWRVKP